MPSQTVIVVMGCVSAYLDTIMRITKRVAKVSICGTSFEYACIHV